MQLVEQHVTVVRVGIVVVAGAVFEQDMALEAEFGRDRAGLARVVGLGRGLLLQRVGHQKLELAGLVAAARQAGAVVALDPQVRAAEMFGQAGQRLQRRGQVGKVQAGKSGKMHVALQN